MATYLHVAQILLSILLIGVILLQARNTGLGSTFGSDSSVFRTRRGFEKTLFQATLMLAGIFITISILSVFAARA